MTRIDPARLPLDTIEDRRSRNQLVGAIGWSSSVLRASLTSRTFAGDDGFQSVTARFALGHRIGSIAAFAEWRDGDSTSLGELSARFSPFSFLSFAAVGSAPSRAERCRRGQCEERAGEVGLRIRNVWLTGGGIVLDSIHVTPLVVFDSTFVSSNEGRTMALFGGIQGRVWRAIHADVFVFRWERQGSTGRRCRCGRRCTSAHAGSEKFPSGQFGALLSARHDYRGRSLVPNIDRAAHRAEQSRAQLPGRDPPRGRGSILEAALYNRAASNRARAWIRPAAADHALRRAMGVLELTRSLQHRNLARLHMIPKHDGVRRRRGEWWGLRA